MRDKHSCSEEPQGPLAWVTLEAAQRWSPGADTGGGAQALAHTTLGSHEPGGLLIINPGPGP